MLRKSVIAAAILIPAIALSSVSFAGQSYQGGPKSGSVKAKQSQAVQPSDLDKAYAQAPRERKGRHVYQGGPWTNVPMATH